VNISARLLVLAIALLVARPTSMKAQSANLAGEWQQLSSNAGQCPDCRIVVLAEGQKLKVTASNGWSAGIRITSVGDPVIATGQGQWPLRREGRVVPEPLDVSFALRGDHLHMTMVVAYAQARKQIVKAVFGRIWNGV
jgi:hypothetical protein